MGNTLLISQTILSAVLIIVIGLQNKGSGFGRAFSAGPTSFTRRGLERLIFRATFVLIGVLIVVSVVQLVV